MLLWIALTIAACFALVIAIGYIFIGITLVGSIIAGDSSFFNSESFGLTLGGFEFVGIVIVIIISKHFWSKFNTQCDVCRRFGALELVNTKILQEASIYVPVDAKRKNIKGETIGSQEQYIPGKRIQYQDTYRCKYCGATENYIRTADKAII